VLAPWEPHWLYPGTVGDVRDGSLFVYFDDGGRGWVPAALTRSLATIGPGSRVFCRWRGGQFYYPAVVERRNAEQLLVRYGEGGTEWNVISMLRVATVASESVHGAVGKEFDRRDSSRFEEDAAPRRWLPGERVLAPAGDGWLYPGAVADVDGDQALIWFDNGNRRHAALAELRPMNLGVGARVFCRWMGGATYYAGRIKEQRGEQIFIHYDDGDKEWNVLALVRVPGSAGTAFLGTLHTLFFGRLGCFVWFLIIGVIVFLIGVLAR
jgi:hypothetical protein